MTLTKACIVENLFTKNLFARTASAQIIEDLFELIIITCENGTKKRYDAKAGAYKGSF